VTGDGLPLLAYVPIGLFIIYNCRHRSQRGWASSIITMDVIDEHKVPLITPTASFDREDRRSGLSCCIKPRPVVIALQFLFGVGWGLGWLFIYITGNYPQLNDDPDIQQQMNEAFKKVSIVYAVGIIVSGVVIFGALIYNGYLVLLGMIYAIIESILVMVFLSPMLMKYLNFYIAGCVIFLLAFLQPHFNFVEEYCRREPIAFGDNLRAEDSELFLNNNVIS
jgi:hypothetical protein